MEIAGGRCNSNSRITSKALFFLLLRVTCANGHGDREAERPELLEPTSARQPGRADAGAAETRYPWTRGGGAPTSPPLSFGLEQGQAVLPAACGAVRQASGLCAKKTAIGP